MDGYPTYVFTQLDDDGQEFVVAYASQSNNKTKAKYTSYEEECLAIVWVVYSFQCYLYGSPFTLVADHQILKFFMELHQFICKLARWALILQKYNFDIVHMASRVNQDANGIKLKPKFQ